MRSQAEQRIEFIYAFLKYPEGFCKEDWKLWRSLIASACVQVTNEDLTKKGTEAMSIFNFYFYKKKHGQL